VEVEQPAQLVGPGRNDLQVLGPDETADIRGKPRAYNGKYGTQGDDDEGAHDHGNPCSQLDSSSCHTNLPGVAWKKRKHAHR
jgi:hypothetical protein